ncbi:MAG: hypothetical protein K0S66_2438 [Sphingomonas sp.]|jgi:4-amino-4-deoxy-L-arabinose transferase-like glycosyltransferase|nr:hypothetical protein [Sphingomonas sp.]
MGVMATLFTRGSWNGSSPLSASDGSILDAKTRRLWAMFLFLAIGAALFIGWVGFMASDDSLYYAGALRWLTDPPFAGSDHWSTRFPLTLTFAAMLAAFGRNYVALGMTAVLFYVVLVALVGRFTAGLTGERSGWIAALLTATLPVVVSHATTVSVDLIEVAALVGGAWLVGRASDDRVGLVRAAAGGALFGIAVLCRETSVLALAALGPLLLIGRPISRRVLIACAVGAAAILAGEALFQWAMTGEPLRRYTIAFHHDEHIDRAANREGNFLLWPPIDPLLVLLINDDFGLLFWLLPVAFARGAWALIPRARRVPLTLLSIMAGVSFLLVAALYTKLVLNPRYFMLAAIVGLIVLAIWINRLPARVAALILTILVSTNLLLMSVGNAHPRWPMEALVLAAQANPGEVVAADEGIVHRAAISMAFIGQDNIRPLPTDPADQAVPHLVVTKAGEAPAGRIVARYPSPPTRLGSLLRTLGLAPLVPSAIAHRMFSPSPEMVLVRTSGG